MSKVHWVALVTAARAGGKMLTRLLAHFGSLEAVFQATPNQLMQVPRVGPRTAAAIAAVDLPAVEADLARFAEMGIRVITWEDPAYPANLLCCDDAPPVLFVRGELSPGDARAVAIIGTRKPTEPGATLAHSLAHELAGRGWTIVSGLAIGVDTAAHQGALEAEGRTLAVLGSGLAAIYPQRNVPLAEAVTERGAVLAEVHPEATVSAQNLIARNRIASGLSRAVIVVQSATDGGSMTTARRAREQGRTVFAVTGCGTGCDLLIEQGAEALTPGHIDWDILSERLDRIVVRPPTDESGRSQPHLL
jgi:DNA processing protein